MEQQINECPGQHRPGDGDHMTGLHVWYRRQDDSWRCVKCRCERPKSDPLPEWESD